MQVLVCKDCNGNMFPFETKDGSCIHCGGARMNWD